MKGQLVKGAERSRNQKFALWVSIISNLSLLGFFKYCNFGIENYNGIVQSLNLSHEWILPSLNIILPLGISFYTFQSMSYTIDIYRGEAEGINCFTEFACYVSMFPQLVAGPIIRFREVADQLQSRTHSFEKFSRGVAFICLGLAKKVLLANPCGKLADTVFNAQLISTLDAWTGALAYSFQIYFDFSGYTDMAIGLGLMLGFVFPKNFDSPYLSKSITEFWQRWHISLSTWLRDYLYIPLGGNRCGKTRTYINLGVVMLLGGLWHGASWTFVVWGAIHGSMLIWERSRGKSSLYSQLPDCLQILITYLIVVVSWVFFRSPDLYSAVEFTGRMFGISSHDSLVSGIIYSPYFLITLSISAITVWFGIQTWNWTQKLTPSKTAVIFTLFFLAVAVLSLQGYNPFIYFIF